MGLLSSSSRIDAPESVADSSALVSWYKRLRATGFDLSNKLVERLPKDVIDEGGRKLGMIRGGALLFTAESDLSILIDYCLHDVRRRGRNAVEQYLTESPPDPESVEMECLRAMQHATYSMILVESVLRGVGVTVRDIFSNGTFLLVDMGFSQTGVPGALFTCRLLRHEGFAMTSGAAIPIGVLPDSNRKELADTMARTVVLDPDGYFDPAPLICKCLRHGCTGQIQYQDPTGRTSGQAYSGGSGPPRRFTKNAPCACGSGRKYKQCCMKRTVNRR